MKRGLCIILVLFYCTYFVTAANLGGVSPSIYEVDFEPFLERLFTFGYFFPDDSNLNITITGDLSEYFEVIETTNLPNRKLVVVKMTLPSEIEIPGPHRIRVGAKPIVPENDQGIAILGDVGGIINVLVPYPGKYAELALQTSYVNAGEDVPYTLTIYSRGNEDITVYPKLKILDEKGNNVKSFDLESRYIESTKNSVYKGVIKTTDFKPGDYNLTAIVEFGGESPTKTTSLFRLGELRLEIINYTKELAANKVGRYFIEIESFWNNPIEDIYGTFRVVGYPDKTFTTPTARLRPWKINRLEGFLDTSDIKAEVVQGEITVYYAENKSTSKMVELNIVKGLNWTLIIIIISIVIFIILLALIVILTLVLIKRKK